MNVNVHTPDQKLKPMHTCTRLQAWARLGVGWVHWDALAQPQSRRNQTRVKTVGYHLNILQQKQPCAWVQTELYTATADSPTVRLQRLPPLMAYAQHGAQLAAVWSGHILSFFD